MSITIAARRRLKSDFAHWTWARFPLRDGNAIVYDTVPRDGPPVSLALRYRSATVQSKRFEPPHAVALPRTGWRMTREVRSETPDDTAARTLEDTPFYARSVVTSRLLGERATGMHESLSLDRFRSPLGAGDAAVPDAAATGWTAAQRLG